MQNPLDGIKQAPSLGRLAKTWRLFQLLNGFIQAFNQQGLIRIWIFNDIGFNQTVYLLSAFTACVLRVID
jgi:hypothetical protein